MAEPFASGNWTVKEGRQDEFEDRWLDFLQWTRKEHPGLVVARLISDDNNSQHYISMAEWESNDARKAWQNSDGFAQRFGACRALCDSFTGGSFSLAAMV